MAAALAPITERLDGIDGCLDGIDGHLDRIEERLTRIDCTQAIVRILFCVSALFLTSIQDV